MNFFHIFFGHGQIINQRGEFIYFYLRLFFNNFLLFGFFLLFQNLRFFHGFNLFLDRQFHFRFLFEFHHIFLFGFFSLFLFTNGDPFILNRLLIFFLFFLFWFFGNHNGFEIQSRSKVKKLLWISLLLLSLRILFFVFIFFLFDCDKSFLFVRLFDLFFSLFGDWLLRLLNLSCLLYWFGFQFCLLFYLILRIFCFVDFSWIEFFNLLRLFFLNDFRFILGLLFLSIILILRIFSLNFCRC